MIDYFEAVAKGFTVIRRGKIRANGKPTYLLEMSDGKSKTLFVELSDNSGYYEVNSADVFRPEYAKNKELI